jgi:hypothetical protein
MYQFKNNRGRPLKKEAYVIKLTCSHSHFSVKGTTSCALAAPPSKCLLEANTWPFFYDSGPAFGGAARRALANRRLAKAQVKKETRSLVMFCDSNASGFILNNKTIKNNLKSVYPSATKYFLKKEKKHLAPPQAGHLATPTVLLKSSFTLTNVLSTSHAFTPPPKKNKGDKIISTEALGYTLKYLKLFYFKNIPNFQANYCNLAKNMPIDFFRTQKSLKSSLLAPLSLSTFTCALANRRLAKARLASPP